MLQVYHNLHARESERGNFSWALPGTCLCTFPFLGPSCQYKFNGNRIRPLNPPEWTPTFGDLLDPKRTQYIETTVGGTSTYSPDSVCGNGVPLQSNGCACPIGVFPSSLRFDPALYAGAGISTGRFSMQDKLLPWSDITRDNTPWQFSQVMPICSIVATPRSPPPPPPAETVFGPVASNPEPDQGPGGLRAPATLDSPQKVMMALNPWKEVNASARACVDQLGRGDLSVLAACVQLAQQLPPRRSFETMSLDPSSDANLLRPIDLSRFTATESVNGGAIALGVIFGIFVLLLGIGVSCAFVSGASQKRGGGYASVPSSSD